MSLKEYHRLADLFSKLNSQENIEDDFTSMPDAEKLKFFWENCVQEKIDSSSIIEKTQRKMRKDAMKRRKKYFLVASASIAASFLICISTIYFFNQNGSVNLDFQAIAEEMDSQSVEEVTLITSKEQLNLDEDVFIKYSKEGKVAVNSQVIKEKEEKTKEEQEYNQLLVPAGKRARVELSDGTRLVVNGGTTNIVLVEGAVEVTDKNEKKARLNPNDLLNIANGTIAYQKQVDVAEYISWVEGIMLLNGNDLSQIIQRLSIYYGISIQCDPIIGKEKVYGKLDLKDDIDEVIECIQQTLPFTIEKSDTSIYLNK